MSVGKLLGRTVAAYAGIGIALALTHMAAAARGEVASLDLCPLTFAL